MKIAIIEDESLALNYLKGLLEQQHVVPVETCYSLRSKKQAIEFFKENTVDLVFMDIHLGDGKSLEIFEEVDLQTPVVFITAYDDYAIKVFKHFTIDYILKPFEPDQLYAALEKFKNLKESFSPENTLQAFTSLDKNNQQERLNRFLVMDGHKLRALDEDRIAYFFASGKYLFITTKENQTYIYEDTIKDIINKINPNLFFKANRKFIVNMGAIAEVIKHSSQKIELILTPEPETDSEVYISKTQIHEWKDWMKG